MASANSLSQNKSALSAHSSATLAETLNCSFDLDDIMQESLISADADSMHNSEAQPVAKKCKLDQMNGIHAPELNGNSNEPHSVKIEDPPAKKVQRAVKSLPFKVHSDLHGVSYSPLCECSSVKTPRAGDTQSRECEAINTIEGKRVGCSAKALVGKLYRPSICVRFLSLCAAHQRRMQCHFCCPTCGLFCIEGSFYECRTGSSLHYFHRACVRRPSMCPHCDGTRIELVHLSVDVYKRLGDEVVTGAKMSVPLTGEEASTSKRPCRDVDADVVSMGFSLNDDESKLFDTALENLVDTRVASIELFHKAVLDADVPLIVQLLGAHANPNALDATRGGDSVMHTAARSGRRSIMALLIRAGGEFTLTNSRLETPLHVAVQCKHVELAAMMVECGADVEATDARARTPLHFAAIDGDVQFAQLLVRELIRRGLREKIDRRDEQGYTALVYAVKNSSLEFARFLLSHGASPLAEDLERNIPLHHAVRAKNQSAVRLLLTEGKKAPPEKQLSVVNVYVRTALHDAAASGHREICEYLILKGADCVQKDVADKTPIDLAKDDPLRQLLRVFASVADTFPEASEPVQNPDFSGGHELYRIPVVNTVDDERLDLPNFTYISKSILGGEVCLVTQLDACTCKGSCGLVVQKCTCAEGGRLFYDQEGKLVNVDWTDLLPQIFECNAKCTCDTRCQNRLVQHGLNKRLELFKTVGKGWGVRTLEQIRQGAFVVEYCGEIISEEELDRRDNDCYIFDLGSETTADAFAIDAHAYGNVSRFLNHSCKPNLTALKVYVEHQDVRFPRIAFFAMRDIAKLEELCFDYGAKFWFVKLATAPCRCGAEVCKYDERNGTKLIEQCIESYAMGTRATGVEGDGHAIIEEIMKRDRRMKKAAK